MAQPIPCDGCGGELAVLMVTSIGNGHTFAVGANCLPGWHIASAQELLDAELVLKQPEPPTPEPAPESPLKSKRGKAKQADAGTPEPVPDDTVADPEPDTAAT